MIFHWVFFFQVNTYDRMLHPAYTVQKKSLTVTLLKYCKLKVKALDLEVFCDEQ